MNNHEKQLRVPFHRHYCSLAMQNVNERPQNEKLVIVSTGRPAAANSAAKSMGFLSVLAKGLSVGSPLGSNDRIVHSLFFLSI